MKLGYLTIIKSNNLGLQCKCICGNKIFLTFEQIKQFDKRTKLTCGCNINSKTLNPLSKLWKKFTEQEKSNWKTWEQFVEWCLKNGYNSFFSIHKIKKNSTYNKDTLKFGLFINNKFFNLQELKEKGYRYSKKLNKLVTSKRFNGKIISQDNITLQINKQKQKHKKIKSEDFKKLTLHNKF